MKFNILFVLPIMFLLIFGCINSSVDEELNANEENESNNIQNSSIEQSHQVGGIVNRALDSDSVDLNSILSLKNNLEYKATYTTVFLDKDKVITGNIIIYSKGDKYRHDSIIGTEETIVSLYLIPEGNYSCIDAIGNVVCNTLKTSSNPNVFFDNLDSAQIVKLPTRTVMNKTGICFMFSNDLETIEQCFLDTGAQLYLHITNSDGTEFTQSLKNIDYNVGDSVFELPQ
ncbi:hypothetical protein KO317_02565 [Candidatus Micrarchaeota archaeon]|nr:hypothetical protein [Candidatus Micrarchaeota archaeon]